MRQHASAAGKREKREADASYVGYIVFKTNTAGWKFFNLEE
jgi:hypothetical protein